MAYNSTFRTAAQLTAVARLRYQEFDALMPLHEYFPTENAQSLDYFFDRKVTGFTDQAEYREFSASNALGKDRPVATLSGRIPPIGRDYQFSEYGRMQLLAQDQRDSAIGDELDKLVRLGADAITRRIEHARIDAVLTGAVKLAENNVYASIDYGRDSSLSKTLTGTATWDKDTGDPVKDIEEWIELSRRITGVIPTSLLLSHDVFETLRVNKNIREGAFAGAASIGARVPRALLVEYLTGETNLLTVTDMSYAYATAELDMGTPWPDKTAVLIGAPGPAVGSTQFGITAHSVDRQYGISAGQRAGIFANAYDAVNNIPDLWVGVNAVALPIMPGVNTVVGGTVL